MNRLRDARVWVILIIGLVAKDVAAAVYEVEYSGTFTAIFDTAGNPGGAFSPAGGITLGDTFNGSFRFDTNNAVLDPSAPPGVAQYDFGIASPGLTINGSSVTLTPKVGLAVGDNGDPSSTESYFIGGIRTLGFDPLPTAVDVLTYFTDLPGFDSTSTTGFEVVLFTFDPDLSALVGTGIPSPPAPLANSFLIYLETINGVTQAAGFGAVETAGISSVPIPSTIWLLGSGLVAVFAKVRRSGLS